MCDKYPNNADGDTLRRIAHNGSDMSKPMIIDYIVALPNEISAHCFTEVAKSSGYQVTCYEEANEWTCYCSKSMLATPDGVIASQKELVELAQPFNGYSDGWGSYGNAE